MSRHGRGLVTRLRSDLRAFLHREEPSEWFWRAPGVRRPNASGVTVTGRTALRVTAVSSCVRVVAGWIATLPLLSDPRGELPEPA